MCSASASAPAPAFVARRKGSASRACDLSFASIGVDQRPRVRNVLTNGVERRALPRHIQGHSSLKLSGVPSLAAPRSAASPALSQRCQRTRAMVRPRAVPLAQRPRGLAKERPPPLPPLYNESRSTSSATLPSEPHFSPSFSLFTHSQPHRSSLSPQPTRTSHTTKSNSSRSFRHSPPHLRLTSPVSDAHSAKSNFDLRPSQASLRQVQRRPTHRNQPQP